MRLTQVVFVCDWGSDFNVVNVVAHLRKQFANLISSKRYYNEAKILITLEALIKQFDIK
jgi:hypothetical protein